MLIMSYKSAAETKHLIELLFVTWTKTKPGIFSFNAESHALFKFKV